MMITRVCKYCGDTYDTEARYSEVCDECKEENHKQKVLNNLFIN